MARLSKTGREKEVYKTFEDWRDRCLVANGSMFNEGEELWALNNIQELGSLVEKEPPTDNGKSLFLEKEKFKEKLKSAPPEVTWLAAEIIWLFYLFPKAPDASKAPDGKREATIKTETKLKKIKGVYEFSGKDLPDSPYLDDKSLNGIASAGSRFTGQHSYPEFVCLLRVLEKWKTELQQDKFPSEDEETRWNFAEWLDEVEDADNRQIRHIILHLLSPDIFEVVSGRTDKRRIFDYYRNRYKDELSEEFQKDGEELSLTELDRALYDLRKLMEPEPEKGKDFHYYDITGEWESYLDARKEWNETRPIKAKDKFTCNTSHPDADLLANGKDQRAVIYQAVQAAGKEGINRTSLQNQLKAGNDKPGGLNYKGNESLDERVEKLVDGSWRWGHLARNGQVRPDWHIVHPPKTKTAITSEDVEGSPDTPTEHPLNQILYGPPGTGKTYQTINYAVAIIENKKLAEIEQEDRNKEVKPLFDKYKEDGRIEMVTFHQNFAYEDFIEGIKPVLDKDSGEVKYTIEAGIFRRIAKEAKEAIKRSDANENFILIIDEINRGNIAKIFGELITLIEDSKRLGKDDALTATLPYSKEEFGVPNNLYIIGTMNTADRSIMQLDTALRRRFEFVELMPDPYHELIDTDIEGVDGQALLETMNKRIRVLLDREHQIGHTYLMKEKVKTLEDLKKTFQNNIMPLLQEYFYDDWQKIDAVLNQNGFITSKDISKDDDPALTEAINLDLVDQEQKVYELLPFDDGRWENEESYRKIYLKNTRTTDQPENQPDTDDDTSG